MSPRPSPTARDRDIAIALTMCLLALYWLSFTGILRSIDEFAIFAITDHLAHGQALDLHPPLVNFAEYHNPVGLIEPGYPLLAWPLYVLTQSWEHISQIHALLLLNPLLTAFTAAMLYKLGRELGYAERACVAVALAFGAGTMAYPFTKSLLREPAVMLLWVIAYWGLARFAVKPGWRTVLWVCAPTLLAISIKISSIAAWPAIFLGLAWILYIKGMAPAHWLVLGSATLLVLSGILAVSLFAARGIPPQYLYEKLIGNLFTREGLIPLYGLLFSPGKSLFIYSPVIVLGLIGWRDFYKRHAPIAASLVVLCAAVIFSLRASQWWGGLTWGPRFLVPLLPLLLLPALELLPHKRWAIGLALLSALYQIIVASVAWTIGYRNTLQPGLNPDLTIGLDWSQWSLSPAVQILRYWGRDAFDLVWLYTGLAHELKIDFILGGWLGFTFICASLALIAVLQNWHGRYALGVSCGVIVMTLPLLLSRAYWDLGDYPSFTAPAAQALASDLSRDSLKATRIVNVSPDFGMYFWLGLIKSPAELVWVSPLQDNNFERLLPTSPGARLAVVVDRPHLAGLPSDNLLAWLNLNTYRLESHWVESLEVVHYATASGTYAPIAADLRWPNGFALNAYATATALARGQALTIDLTLTCLTSDWSRTDKFFAHLLSDDGTLIYGQDGLPQYGHLNAWGCSAGQTYLEKRGIWIPADTPPGDYHLVIGFSNEHGFVPATMPTGETADFATLAHITVIP